MDYNAKKTVDENFATSITTCVFKEQSKLPDQASIDINAEIKDMQSHEDIIIKYTESEDKKNYFKANTFKYTGSHTDPSRIKGEEPIGQLTYRLGNLNPNHIPMDKESITTLSNLYSDLDRIKSVNNQAEKLGWLAFESKDTFIKNELQQAADAASKKAAELEEKIPKDYQQKIIDNINKRTITRDNSGDIIISKN